jgi:NADP-dependent 3-hydroxy acid dehydrogenase YdfG
MLDVLCDARYCRNGSCDANVVAFAIDQPEDTTINEFTVGPANQPW